MADASDSKDFGKRPEADDDTLQPESAATPATGDVAQMEHVNNQPTTTQNKEAEEPSIPTAAGANNNMPISLQDVMSETDPVSPASQTDGAQPDPDSISQASHQSASGSPTSTEAPVCNITLLLPTGARHPYKIDEKYLSKRGVEIPETVSETRQPDPFSISVYKLKELILREWREEWEGKPASPTSIRLIHFGKLLDDKESLKSECTHLPDFVFFLAIVCVWGIEIDGEDGGSCGRRRIGRIGSGR